MLAHTRAKLGWLLFCGGLLLSVNSWLARILWGGLALDALYRIWRAHQAKVKNPDEESIDILEGDIPLTTPLSASETMEQSNWFKLVINKLGTFVELTRLLWVAVLSILFVVFGGRYLVTGLVIFAVLWGMAGLTGQKQRYRSAADLVVVLLVLMVPVTLWATAVPELTQVNLGYFLAQIILLYAILVWTRSERRVSIVTWSLLGLVALLGIVSLSSLSQVNRLFPAIKFPSLPFSLPQTIQKNVLAGVLVIFLPLGVCLIIGQLQGRLVWLRIIPALILTLLIASVLVLTQSYGAYIASAISMLFIMVIGLWGRWKILIGAILISGLGIAVLFWSGLLELVINKLLQSGSTLDTLEGRIEVWQRAIYAIQDFPFTGIGLGTFSKVIPTLYPYFLAGSDEVPHAHNLLLQVGVDIGLPGLIGFLALLILAGAIGFKSWHYWKDLNNWFMQWVTLGCLGGYIAMIIHGMVDAVTWGTKPAFISWALLGLLLSSGQIAIEKTEGKLLM